MSKKELEYQKIGDFYLPKVSFPAEDDKIENIGKYGLLRLEYLKEHKKGYYTFLMISGSVPFELRNVDSAANERVKKIISFPVIPKNHQKTFTAYSPISFR